MGKIDKHLLKLAGGTFAVVALVLLGFGAVRLVHAATLAPDATYATTTDVAATPNQAARWQITMLSTTKLAYMSMTLDSSMLQGVNVANLQVVTTLPSGTLKAVPGGLQYLLATQQSVTAGTRIWMTISGLTMPPAGSSTSTIRLVGPGGVVLEMANASLTMKPRVACRTTAWPSNYIKTENNLPGTSGWQIDPANPAQISNKLAAYAENPSVACGDTVNLRVNDLDLATLSITAYRLGYYGGTGARAVWQTTKGPWLLGNAQTPALFIAKDASGNTINMVTAKNWSRSFSFAVDGSWTPGSYLIALRTSSGQGRYVPIVVRDDLGNHAQKVLLNSSEWQAYNSYGGSSAYTSTQSRRISYDRPYLANAGSGNLLKFEYGYIYWAEKQQLDVSYIMDTDAFANLNQFNNQQMITLIGHPEYWTVGAAQRLEQARAGGTNILSLTANALYWRIVMGNSTLTGPNREFDITKLPNTPTDTFRMGGLPEQTILGAQYGCNGAYGDATSDSGWLWTNVVPGTTVPSLIGVEADEQMPGWPTAQGAEIVQSVPLTRGKCYWSASLPGVAINAPGCPDHCNWDDKMSAATVMVISGIPGGRVFHASSINWPTTLLTSTAAGQATQNAISFLQSGLAIAGTSGTSTNSGVSSSKLAAPTLQLPGLLSPSLPNYPDPEELPGQ